MHDLSASMMQAALRPFRYFASDDLEQTRDQISSVFCPHSLVPDSRMRTLKARMDFLGMAGLGLGTLHLGGAMSVQVPEMSDYYLLLFCLQGQAEVVTEGARLRIVDRQGFVCNPGQAFQAAFSADAEQLFIRLDRRMVWQHTGARRLRFQSSMDADRPALAAMASSIAMLLSNPATIGLVKGNAKIAREYEQLLVSLILAGQPHADEAKERQAGLAPASVRRAESFLRSHAAWPLTLQEIAAAAGVPVRTLLDSFQRFRGKSPIRMLRDIRLGMARDALSRDGDARVADVALACGFGHLGRFAHAYREHFGEHPSDTRARRPRSGRHGHAATASASMDCSRTPSPRNSRSTL